MRLDVFLIQNAYVDSRTKASNLIKIGKVFVNGNVIIQPSYNIIGGEKIEIIEDNFASLGSFKLKKALSDFSYSPKGISCVDIGAANGGFTDVLLGSGAAKVYAVDVGECALSDKLKSDSRVVIMEKTNARYITKENFDCEIGLVTVDVSFISLKLILPVCYEILQNMGYVIALIKPQFEVTKKDLPKSGVLRNKKLIEKVVDGIRTFSDSIGFSVLNITEIPILFKEKNIEYLIFLQKANKRIE